jgi:hypothetical protein
VPVSNVSTGPRLVTAEEAARRLGRAADVGAAEGREGQLRSAAPEPEGG